MSELRIKLALTLALVVVDAIWIVLAGFSFDMGSLVTCAGLAAAMAGIGFVYTRLRPDERLATMGTEVTFLIVYSAAACIFSYLVTSFDRPLIDDWLVKVDDAVGFDWYGYVAFVNARPWLGVVSSALYSSTLLQIALAVLVLAMMGMKDRTREMIGIVMLSSLMCVIVSGILPSAGALAYYHPDASFYMQNQPVVDLAYKQAFFDMRSGALRHLSLSGLHGLVAFPSYHVGLSVILMVAFRGVKGWFWPIVVLNTLVILSTPIDGGHHLSDGLGGAVLALACAAVLIRLRKLLPKKVDAGIVAAPDYGALAGQKA